MTAPLPDASPDTAEPDAPHLRLVPDPGAEVAVRARVSLNEKLVYAQHLAQSGLLPTSYRRQPANVLYAMEYASMLGLSPMAALTGIHVIEGKPTASAALMSALVRREHHKLRVTFDQVAMSATAQLVRADDPDFTFTVTWDLTRAVAAGLCTLKDGRAYSRDSKGRAQPWEKYTPNMLKWRAISEVCRDGAEECLMGMHYTPEELGADVDADGNVIQATAEDMRPAASPMVDIDWDAKIAEIADDPEALTLLWKSAPRDSEARERIAAAGSAAAAKRKAAREATPGPDDIVDAELVEAPPVKPAAADLPRVAARLADALLSASLPEHAAQIIDADVEGQPVGLVNVSGLLAQDDRDVLGITAERLTLEGLGTLVCTYTAKYLRSVRNPLDLDPSAAS